MKRAWHILSHSRCIRLIRGTIAFNCCVLAIILMLFLRIVFSLVPDISTVSVTFDSLKPVRGNTLIVNGEAILEYNSDLIEVSGIRTIRSNKREEVFFEADGNTYSDEYYIEIPVADSITISLVNEYTQPMSGRFIFENTQEMATEINIWKNSMGSLVQGIYARLNTEHELLFESNNEVLIQDSNNKNLYVKNAKDDTFSAKVPCCKMPAGKKLLALFSPEHTLGGITRYEITAGVNEISSSIFFDASYIDISGSGTLHLFNTATTKDYDFYTQNVVCQSINGKEVESNNQRSQSLDVYMRNVESSTAIEYDGSVNEITISDHSLKPTIGDWILDNVYMVPTLLVTILGGGISLANSKRKNS